MQTINASDFKAKCLALLDQVERTGEEITVLKRGRPVARLLPVPPTTKGLPQHSLLGTVRVVGDILAPALPPEAWDATRGKL